MLVHAVILLSFSVLHAHARTGTESNEALHPQNVELATFEKRGLLQGLLGGSQSAGGSPSAGRSRADDSSAGYPTSLVGGLLDGVGSVLPLGTGGGLNDLLKGSPSYNPAASAAAPGRPSPSATNGDAPWTQSEAAYRQMITCPRGIGGQRGVVLLVPPTGGSGNQAWARSPYAQFLPQHGFGVCWVDNPTRSTGDIQLTAEFVAYAIKYLGGRSGRPLNVITYSQGGLNTQWALTFWPSTRRWVRNLVTLASPFHGTIAANAVCPLLEVIGGCLPALFQMLTNSRLVKALNAPVQGSGAVALVPTTSVYTRQDEIVMPQVGARPISYLNGASNIALQDICGAAHVADHFLIVGDLGAYAIALDALMSGRPANPATVDKSYCNQLASLSGQFASLGNDLKYVFSTVVGNVGDRVSSLLKTVTSLTVPTEPALQMYVCQKGFATGCTANGFAGPQGRAPILSSLPQALSGLLGSG